MKGGAAPQPAAPAAGPIPGPMPGPMPAEMPQQSPIDLSKGPSGEQKQQQEMAMIVEKIEIALQKIGYYDLPENKGRGPEIQKEISELAQAIVNNDAEALKSSEIYSFITSRKGQREAMREPVSMLTESGGPADGSQG